MEKSTVTFEEAKNAEVGKIFVDRFDEGLRFVIMRGPVALCAYIGVPENHPLAGHNYEWLPIQAHYGLTYGQVGGTERGGLPAGYYWYGWDYAHSGDLCFYDHGRRDRDQKEKAWTVAEVEADSWDTLYGFRNLLKLSEAIANRYRWSPK